MSIDLAVPGPLGGNAQFVQDQQNNQSPLAISTTGVGIGTASLTPNMALTVSGNVGFAPLVAVSTPGPEAAIRYLNGDSLAWHVGSGGQGPGLGPKTFFFWNQSAGGVVTITADGTMNVLKGGLNVNGLITANNLKINVPNTAAAAAAPDSSRLVSLMVDPETGEIYLQR